ncbi:hypothetical protein SAMN04488156_10688 [Bacillus sp. 166amftsu]|nr:hypothetical protein SAMN04488156_10688 [Bacillus sp. 166amftsu]
MVCGSIKGHGQRIVNERENYVVAGAGKSKVMHWEKSIV